jgi:indole-3-acetate monooxygenase
VNKTLSRVREMLPEVSKRAEEIEQGRGVPTELVEALVAAGCVRMIAPRRYGGDELPMPDVLRVLAELARADGATAWLVGQIALSQLIIGSGSDGTVREVYRDGPDLFAAGAIAPKGRATAIGDSWRITGQWPFVTGCAYASWFYLNCVLVSGRSVRTTAAGSPQTRILVVPAADVKVLDTWHALGLRGTGSHDVLASGALCADDRGLSLLPDGPETAHTVASIAQSSLIIAAVSVGIAAGALDEIIGIAAGGKRPALSATALARSAVFQDRLGAAQTSLRGAEALLHAEADAAWRRVDSARAGAGGADARERAQTRAAATHVIDLARAVVDTAHALGGGTAAYETSPLARRLRDMHTATQHVVAGREAYGVVGAMLVGEEVDVGPF